MSPRPRQEQSPRKCDNGARETVDLLTTGSRSPGESSPEPRSAACETAGSGRRRRRDSESTGPSTKSGATNSQTGGGLEKVRLVRVGTRPSRFALANAKLQARRKNEAGSRPRDQGDSNRGRTGRRNRRRRGPRRNGSRRRSRSRQPRTGAQIDGSGGRRGQGREPRPQSRRDSASSDYRREREEAGPRSQKELSPSRSSEGGSTRLEQEQGTPPRSWGPLIPLDLHETPSYRRTYTSRDTPSDPRKRLGPPVHQAQGLDLPSLCSLPSFVACPSCRQQVDIQGAPFLLQYLAEVQQLRYQMLRASH